MNSYPPDPPTEYDENHDLSDLEDLEYIQAAEKILERLAKHESTATYQEVAQEVLERIVTKGLTPITSSQQEAIDIQFLIGTIALNGVVSIWVDYPDGAPEWHVSTEIIQTRYDGEDTGGEYEAVGPSLRAALQALYSKATGMGQPLQLEPIPPPFGTMPQDAPYEPDPRD